MTIETFSIFLGAIITLCCFSFLWKDNPAYRVAESLFVGVSAGYYLSVVYFHQVLKPLLLAKLFPSLFVSGAAANVSPDYWLIICNGSINRLSNCYFYTTIFDSTNCKSY
jgi:hypothetical protein